MHNLLLVVFGTAAYGAALGWWRSPEMALYIAIKLPLVFLLTTVIVSAFSWMTALLAGFEMRYREVYAQMFAAMADAAKVLAALMPVVLFLILSGAPARGGRDELRFVHSCLMLVHLVVLAGAGVMGVVRLYRNLHAVEAARQGLPLLLGCWLAAFALVGSEVGWIMRPLVGSPNIRVEFLREDALERNFFESLSTQILPHFIHKGRITR